MISSISYNIAYIALIGCFYFLFNKSKYNIPTGKKSLFVVLAVGFAIRLLSPETGFPNDIHAFKYWADKTVELGFGGFYSGGFFSDYPPGYMYVLNVIQHIINFFEIPYDSPTHTLMFKMPSIIAEIFTGLFIYKLGCKFTDGQNALLATITYIFCPALIFTTSVWGQVDSILILITIGTFYLLWLDKTIPAAIIFALGILVKPQALLFGPILLFMIIRRKSLIETAKAVIVGSVTLLAVAYPFAPNGDLTWLIDLYSSTISGYSYFSVNGYNYFTAIGLNWANSSVVGGIWTVNYIVIPVAMIVSAYIFFKEKSFENILRSAFVLLMTIYSFATMMHERYILPAMVILLFIFAISRKIWVLIAFLIMQVLVYFNLVIVYDYYANSISVSHVIPMVISGLFLLFFVATVAFPLMKSIIKLQPKYQLSLLVITFTVLTLFRLGATSSPESFYQSKTTNEFTLLDFGQYYELSDLYIYSGLGDEYYEENTGVKKGADFTLSYHDGQGNWVESPNQVDVNTGVFKWEIIPMDNISTNNLLIKTNDSFNVIYEIVVKDKEGNVIPVNISSAPNSTEDNIYPAHNMIDEQHLAPVDSSSYYSMIFDEVYHGRTAYEFENNLTVYETTHPHLGKLIIQIGIAIFGMNPFGYRIMSALAGILIIPLIYILAKELFKSPRAALVASMLAAFDCMRYTQSRIATVDSILVMFMIITFIFMVKYQNSYEFKEELINLTLSGVFMGLTVSVKWNGAYPMFGLAIYFFFILFNKYRLHKDISRVFKTIGYCFFAFVLLPFLVYFIMFMPVLEGSNITEYINDFIRWQVNMFDYHTQLQSDHSFASPWYQWIVIARPIWYSVFRYDGNYVSTISSFGNPMIWWAFILSVPYCLYKAVKNKDNTAAAIVICYLSALLPWIIISRETFIYHYFPVTIFGILSIVYLLKDITSSFIVNRNIVITYCLLVVAAFVIYFPMASGLPASTDYLNFFELAESWFFI